MREEKILSPIFEIDKQPFSWKLSKSFDCDKYSNGDTYVPLEASMIIQNETNNRKIQATIDTRGEGHKSITTFSKYCSSTIYPCQTMTSYSAMVPKVPDFNSIGQNTINTRLFWMVASLLYRIEKSWQLFKILI